MSYEFIVSQQKRYPISRLCKALDVSRQGYYAWRERDPSARQRENAELAIHIEQIFYQSNATYGSPRIRKELAARGMCSGYEGIRRIMK